MLPWAIHAFFLIINLSFASALAHAAIQSPVRNHDEISGRAKPETVSKVKTAKVVLADYPLLKKDFPTLQSYSNAQIDEWILKNSAFVARPQTKQTETNSEIELTGDEKVAHRPHGYRRGLVFDVPGGVLDAKGMGSLTPKNGSHSNGLADLGEAIREYLMEKMTNSILEVSPLTTRTVGIYAVVDWGFDVKYPDRASQPSGYVLRQASRRGYVNMLPDAQVSLIEKHLRRFGLTTGGDRRHRKFEYLNMQGTEDGDLIDHGSYLFLEHFDKPALPYRIVASEIEKAESNSAAVVASALLYPSDADYIQPDPKFRVPFAIWGHEPGLDESWQDYPWKKAHLWAQEFRQGKLSRGQVEMNVQSLLEAGEEKIKSSPKNLKPLAPRRPYFESLQKLLSDGKVDRRAAAELLVYSRDWNDFSSDWARSLLEDKDPAIAQAALVALRTVAQKSSELRAPRSEETTDKILRSLTQQLLNPDDNIANFATLALSETDYHFQRWIPGKEMENSINRIFDEKLMHEIERRALNAQSISFKKAFTNNTLFFAAQSRNPKLVKLIKLGLLSPDETIRVVAFDRIDRSYGKYYPDLQSTLIQAVSRESNAEHRDKLLHALSEKCNFNESTRKEFRELLRDKPEVLNLVRERYPKLSATLPPVNPCATQIKELFD